MKTLKRILIWLLVTTQVLWSWPAQAVTVLPADEAKPSETGQAATAPPITSAPGPEAKAIRPNRTVPAVKPVPQAPVFSAWPTVEEISRARVFEEPLVPVRGIPTASESRALAAAVRAYVQAGAGESVSPFLAFLEGHSVSVWRPSLQLNLGLVYRRTGYYTRAQRALEEAWAVAKDDTDPRGTAVADRALGELVQLNARFGNQRRLRALLEEMGGRDVRGSAREMIEQAKQAQWLMESQPDRTLLCGPLAVDRIHAFTKKTFGRPREVAEFRAGPLGTTLVQMRDLARRLGMDVQMAKRVDLQSELLLPALVHLALGHFVAVLKSDGSRVLVDDPTIGPARWISRRALDEEASGYALVPTGQLLKGWRSVADDEAGTIWGTGATSDNSAQCQTCKDHQSGGSGSGGSCTNGFCSRGLASYSFHTMLVSLYVFDTPVGYAPPRGPSVAFDVSYHQREVFQPQIFTYWNLGAKWTSSWLSYVEDDPTVPGQPVNLYVPGGGQETYSNYNSTTGAYAYHWRSQAQIVRTSDNPVVYERRLPDGSVDIYAQPDGTFTNPRKVFLTRKVNPLGNAVQLTYDSSLRLVALTDAIGQVTTVSYELASDPLKVTKVTDPFGRSASFQYDGSGRLARITDVIGLASAFGYGAGDLMTTLTTPYGTTTFRANEQGRMRWLEATDPLGATEHLEYINRIGDGINPTEAQHFQDGLPYNEVPTGFYWAGSPWSTSYYWYRNTFFWSKRAYAVAPGDYTAAKLVHWLHTPDGIQTTGVIENEKEPLESVRTFYRYPNQPYPLWAGTSANPTSIGKVTDDGSSQIWRYEYNAIGKPIQQIDPLGREIDYVYGNNNTPDSDPVNGTGNDLLQVKRKNGSNYDVLQSYTYNSQHEPLTINDARGAVTTYTYNSAGQTLTVTTPPAQGQSQGATTSFTYDTNGYLTQVSGPVPGATTSITYDAYGRRRTSTDPAGLTLTYDYDALDRVTQVTYPDGTSEQTTYNRLDAEGSRDRLGHWTRVFHDALRRVVATRDPVGGTTQYQYGGSGCPSCGGSGNQLTALTDPNGNQTSWAYDVQGRVTQETRADSSSESYTYEATSSRLHQKTDRKGVVTTFAYVLDNKLAGKTYSDTTPAVSYTYDPVTGQMLTAANGTDTLTWTYDNLDRVSTEASTKNASTVGYGYDNAGNRVALTLNGSGYLTYAYDQQSRLTGITYGSQNFGFGYDAASRRSAMTYPNGVVTSYGYDTESRLTSLAASLGSTPITSFSYALDAAGNRTNKTTLDWTESYGYDAASKLVAVDRSTGTPSRWRFAYDPAGNRTTDQADDAAMAGTNNNLNELLSRQAGGALTFKGTTNKPATVTVAGKSVPTSPAPANVFSAQAPISSGTSNVVVSATDPNGNTRTNTYQVSASGAGGTYTYDANGNLATKTEGSNAWTYSWDAENQLTQVQNNGTTVATFAYDPLGRRVQKVAGGVTTAWAYDGASILRQLSGASTLKYIHGPGIDEPLASDDGTALSSFHADGLGSIAKVTNAAGVVLLTRQYDAWGHLQAGSTAGYAFTGREWDPETALYYYRARYYDPTISRFISEDPLRLRGARIPAAVNPLAKSLSAPNAARTLAVVAGAPMRAASSVRDALPSYAYADNEPVRKVDPSGFSAMSAILHPAAEVLHFIDDIHWVVCLVEHGRCTKKVECACSTRGAWKDSCEFNGYDCCNDQSVHCFTFGIFGRKEPCFAE